MTQKAATAKTTDSKNSAAPAAVSKLASQPSLSPQEQLLQLHRQYGNRAVQMMYETGQLQAKLNIGPPGDRYEREADSVAERVMSMANPQIRPKPT